MTECLAVELGNTDGRVNAIAPWFVDSDMTRDFQEDPKLHERALANVLLHRTASPEEIVGPLLFLVSDIARYVTGHTLAVDGGSCWIQPPGMQRSNLDSSVQRSYGDRASIGKAAPHVDDALTTNQPIEPLSAEETVQIVQEGNVPVSFDERCSKVFLYRTLANDPGLLKAWLPICDCFIYNKQISAYDREVLILRTARKVGSEYEWAEHIVKTEPVGLSEADVYALRNETSRPDDGSWLYTLLTLTDVLHAKSTVSDNEVHTAAGEVYVLLVLKMVGEYQMLSYALSGAKITVG